MADIGNEIDAIRAALVGEQVREDIAVALEKMNEQAESAEAWATGGEGGTAAADNNAKYYAEQAAASAATAAATATSGVEAKALATTLDSRVNAILSLVDYGYDDSDLPGTVAASVGISRNKSVITLNNTEATPGARIRLNGSLVRVAYSGAAANATVDGWTGITLHQNHIYKLQGIVLDGQATVSSGPKFGLSVYEQGTHGTVGRQEYSDAVFTRWFQYKTTPVNIVLLGVPTAIYTNYKIIVTLEDITESAAVQYKALNASFQSNLQAVNYGFYEAVGLEPTAGVSNASVIGIEQIGRVVRLNGTNSLTAYVRIRLCNGILRTSTDSVVDEWTGINVIPGHIYEVLSTLIDGTVTYPGTVTYTGVPVSIYRNGEHATIGKNVFYANGQLGRVFTSDVENVTPAIVLAPGTICDNATFTIEITDITPPSPEVFLQTAKTYKLFARDNSERDIAQSCVCVDGCLYVYHYLYDGTTFYGHGIRKIDFANGTDTQYDMNLGHGNGMAYYDGFLFVCDMEITGKIHKIRVSDMAQQTPIVFKINGVATYNSGIAYDAENDQFIIKTDTGFAFATTSFEYKSLVTRSQTVPGTGQSISCDGQYIYEIKSGPNYIYIFDHTGLYKGSIAIPNTDEAEGMYNDWTGGWYILTNVAELGWYVDTAQIFAEITMDNVIAMAKLYGAVGYNGIGQ